ncbi:TerB family tellurite resistance protein [Ferrigenium sp. UT5]|uniref:tellurite resistance TerB family protein n=1 Tax=Ferrigenium sp. UT5 TaxID=3242105 RepID=UPI0035542B1F
MLSKLNEFFAHLITPNQDAQQPTHTLQLATAVLLVEVMRADAASSEAELATVMRALKERFQLSDSEGQRLSALGQETARHASDLYQFTSLLNRELSREEKVRIAEYMWQVAYADRHLGAHENHLMRRMTELLHLSQADYITAKMRAKPAGME